MKIDSHISGAGLQRFIIENDSHKLIISETRDKSYSLTVYKITAKLDEAIHIETFNNLKSVMAYTTILASSLESKK